MVVTTDIDHPFLDTTSDILVSIIHNVSIVWFSNRTWYRFVAWRDV